MKLESLRCEGNLERVSFEKNSINLDDIFLDDIDIHKTVEQIVSAYYDYLKKMQKLSCNLTKMSPEEMIMEMACEATEHELYDEYEEKVKNLEAEIERLNDLLEGNDE